MSEPTTESLRAFKAMVLSTREPQTIEIKGWTLKAYSTGTDRRVSDACVERPISLAASTPAKIPDMASLRWIISTLGAPEGLAQKPRIRGRDPSGSFSALFSWSEIIESPAAQQPPQATPPRQGRNDRCLCRSGKKFKKCCGLK